MNLMNRLVDRSAQVRWESEEDPIKKAAMGLREYIPAELPRRLS